MRQAREKRRVTPARVMASLHREELAVHGMVAWSTTVLIAGILGSSSTVYHPTFLSRNQLRTRAPCSPSHRGVT